NIHHVEQQLGPLDMSQKLQPQSGASMRAFNQTRDVCYDKGPIVAVRYDAQIWMQSSERIVCDLWSGSGNPGDQGRLAGVRERYQANVSDQLQFEIKDADYAGSSFLVMARRPIRRGGKLGVAAASAASRCDVDPPADRGKVVHQRSGLVLGDEGADRNQNREAVAIFAVAVAPFAVASALRPELRVEPELQKRVELVGRFHVDRAAVAAVAS